MRYLTIAVIVCAMVGTAYGNTYQNQLPDANGNPTYYTQNDDGSVTTTYQQGGLPDANGNPSYYDQSTGQSDIGYGSSE